ncbi:MAG: transposase [Candidatus Thiodiazotropha sp.]
MLESVGDKTVSAKPHGGGQSSKLSGPDLDFLLAMKKEKPTITYSEMRECLRRHSHVPGGSVSLSLIGKIVRQNFDMTFKKVTRPEGERFSAKNLRYTQAFIDHIQTLNPNKVLFMDESGYKPIVAHRSMGHSECGVRCIEVTRYQAGPHITLNLLVALNGPHFYNFIDGSSTMAYYVQFFTDAYHANTNDGMPIISPGDVIVVDNSPLHHNQAEFLLSNFFAPLGVQIIFMTRYSPDFSPESRFF